MNCLKNYLENKQLLNYRERTSFKSSRWISQLLTTPRQNAFSKKKKGWGPHHKTLHFFDNMC